MTQAEKERIAQLCTEWRNRSRLNIPMIVGRIQTYGVDIDRNQFNNRFVRLNRTSNIEPELILAVVAAFTKGLTQSERCTIEEAMEFAALARLPHSRLDELKSYFSDVEVQQTNDSQPTVIRDKVQRNQQPNTNMAPPTPLPAIAPSPPADFVGRGEALEKISEALLKGESTAITALQGMGGIGKTALAQMLAERLKSHFSGGIFWADLAGHNGSAEPILRAWAAVCGADLSQEPDANVLIQLVRGLLAQRQQQNGPLLAVVDDVRTEPTWLSTAGLLRQTLPPGTPLLLTARNEGLTEELADYTWRVDLLTETESQDLLTERVRHKGILQPIKIVQQLLAALGYLPLAIRLASGYLNRRGGKVDFQLATFVQRVEKAAAKLLDTDTAGLVATFQISYEALDDTEQRVFRYLSVYSDPLLTVENMAGLLTMDAATTEDFLDMLVEAAMLDRDQNVAKRYRLHPLLRQYSYELLQESGEGFDLHRAAATYLQNATKERDAIPEERLEEVDQWQKAEEWESFIECASSLVGSLDRVGYWPEIEQRLIQAQNALTHIPDEIAPGLAAMVLNNRGMIADNQARWDDAIDYYEQALRISQQLGDISGIAEIYNNLSPVYQSKGEWNKAIRCCEQAMQTFEQIDEPQHIGATYNNLGISYHAKGEWEKAIGYYEQSLEIDKQQEDTYSITITNMNLGRVYADKGEWEKAINYYQQSLESFEKMNDLHSMASTNNCLGLVYVDKGEWEKAIDYYQQALNMYEQVGDIHNIATTWMNLGIVYHAQEKWGKAINYYEQSLQTKESVGDIHGIAQIYNNLGLVYKDKGEQEKAIDYYQRSLQTKDQMDDVYGIAITWMNLGLIYVDKEEYDKAIDYYLQALHIQEKIGDIHGIAKTKTNLGLVYADKEEWDTAISYYMQSLKISKQMDDIHGMASTYNNLGLVYTDQEKWEQAVHYYMQALKMYGQVDDIHGVAQTKGNLGIVYANKREWDQAIDYYLQALQIDEQMGGVHGMAPTRVNLGNIYKAKGEYDKAIHYYLQALHIDQQTGNIHGMASTYNNLGLVYADKKEWDKAIDYYLQDIEISKRVGDTPGIGITYNNLGNVYRDKEEWDNANDYYRQSLEIYEQLDSIYGSANVWMDMGILFMVQNLHEEAQSLLAQSFLIFAEMDAPEVEIAEAKLIEACGSDEEAKAYLEENMATDQDTSEIDVNTVAGSEEEDDES